MSADWYRRLRQATLAALIHFWVSLAVALLAAWLVWGVWYPHPYDELSGGRELFLLIVAVDVVCGPALTLVVFDRRKPRAELRRDLSFIGLLQLAALLYGLHVVMEARPLYLVHEVDRFRAVTRADYLGVDVSADIARLPPTLQPRPWAGPIVVGTRAPRDAAEHTSILFDAMRGGRDYSQRPDFYLPYDDAYGPRVLQRARPLTGLIEKNPDLKSRADAILASSGTNSSQARYVPVVHRQDWVAIVDSRGRILGFVKGDGFAVR